MASAQHAVFHCSREFGAFLGLTPKQTPPKASTARGISKMGTREFGKSFVVGAHASVSSATSSPL
jgi:hypothetical protein